MSSIFGFLGTAAARCLALAPVVALSPGCAARVTSGTVATVDGYDAVYIDDWQVPASIEGYPRYAYYDGYAYYVGGRWYHRHGNHWVYYRQAPRELVRQRAVVQEAPPARRADRENAYARQWERER
jgi:hypothetical protein